MSQMFETDIASLLPDDHDNVATHTHLLKTIQSLRGLRERVEQLEKRELRLLDTIELLAKHDNLLGARSALHLDYIERLENLVAQCCAKLNIPVPFPGQDDDFGLSPRPKKAQGES